MKRETTSLGASQKKKKESSAISDLGSCREELNSDACDLSRSGRRERVELSRVEKPRIGIIQACDHVFDRQVGLLMVGRGKDRAGKEEPIAAGKKGWN